MVDEKVILAEKEYLVNVLGKKLIDSEERDDRKDSHRRLAKKYWPEEFTDNVKKHVHHINFDHYDNRVCNLVVLTIGEHRLIHKLFDPKWNETQKKKSKSMKGKNVGSNNGMYGKGYKITGEKNYWYGKRHPNPHAGHPNPHKGQTWKVIDGKRTWVNK